MGRKAKSYAIKLPTPHAAQQEVLDGWKRLNAVNCGRRWGKSEVLGTRKAVLKLIERNRRVGWFAPNYRQLLDIWREMNKLFGDAGMITRRDVQEKRIELVTGSAIDFWTLDNPDAGRGKKYHLVIVDEAAMVKNLLLSWQGSILPTLADFQGDALLMSTPKGHDDWYKICRLFEDIDQGAFFQMPTSTNPYIKETEFELAKMVMSENLFKQEYEAVFTSMADRVIYNFDYEDNTLPPWEGPPPQNCDLLIGMDFNVAPMTAVIGYIFHRWDDVEKVEFEELHIFDEISIRDVGTAEMCQEIVHRYGDRIRDITVFPDPTGGARSTIAEIDATNFTIIEDHGLRYDTGKTPKFEDKINEANALALNANGERRLYVHRNCVELISDLEQFTYKKGTSIPDKGGHDHRVDALCNIIHRRFPIIGAGFSQERLSGI